MRALLLFFLCLASPAAFSANGCQHPEEPKPSKLPTGNGLGYGVVSGDGAVTTFLAHPYTRVRPIPGADGEEDTAELAGNFLKSARWSLDGRPVAGKAAYLDQSHVVETRGGGLRQTAFQPLGLGRNALILTAATDGGQASAPKLDFRFAHPVKRETSREVNGKRVRVLELEGVEKALAVVPLTGGNGFALVSLDRAEDAAKAAADVQSWQGSTPAAALGAREAAEADKARPKRGNVCFTSPDEKRLFRQNETILKMAQIREPNSRGHTSEGMINASLPEGEFAVPYVRDMAYAAVSLSATGHGAEAEKALVSYFNAQPMGVNQEAARGLPYQISTTRYFGNGAEEADSSGNPRPNLEFDDWGLALWAMGRHHASTSDTKWLDTPTYRGTVYESARDYVIKPLFGNLDATPGGGLIVAKDSSVWEQNDEPFRHNAASTIAAIGGLKAFLPIAIAKHDEKTASEIREKLARLEKGFQETFVKNGAVLGAAKDEPSRVKDLRGRPVPGRNDTDGSVLEAINMGVITDRGQAEGIVTAVEQKLKAPTGGYRRTNGPTGYERQEFVFISINLARAYLRLGEPGKAEALMKRVRELAAKDNDLIPELYQAECMPKEEDFQKKRGSPAGAIPMVGYGAGAYNLYLQERNSLLAKGAVSLPGGFAGGDTAAIASLKGACGAGNAGAEAPRETSGENGSAR